MSKHAFRHRDKVLAAPDQLRRAKSSQADFQRGMAATEWAEWELRKRHADEFATLCQQKIAELEATGA